MNMLEMRLISGGRSHDYHRRCGRWARVCHVTLANRLGQHQCRRHLSSGRESEATAELNRYLSADFGGKYPLKSCEQFWSDFWRRNDRVFGQHRDTGAATAADGHSGRPPFTLLLPPPNITGNLHLGHAMTLAIEDTICRYHRMRGHPCRWTPGLDHAGIATQMVVEKYINKSCGKTRHEMSAEEFLAHIRQWKAERERDINEQIQRLGVSLDFERQYYTLSEEMSPAVTEAFIRLFNSGHIYRHSMAVNWSFYLPSTLSDIEVEHKRITGPTRLSVPGFDGQVLVGVMHRFNYPIADTDGSGGGEVIPIATTRLETILGD
ncbi:unnamed protein product, partial [Medioppia subpectinata]